jgi:hypothetical protein
MSRFTLTIVLGLALVLAARGPAAATVLVPMADEDLVESSAFIVVGQVIDTESVETRRARIETRVTLAIETTIKGHVVGETIVLRQPGGRVGGRGVYIHGAPEFAVGEDVLVFLRRTRRGTLQVNGLALGLYRIEEWADGARRAVRTMPTVDVRELDEFVTRLRGLVGSGPFDAYRAPADGAADSDEPVTARFTLLGPPGQLPARWFEPDNGLAVGLRLVNNDAALGRRASEELVARAFATWTDVPSATIVLLNAGIGVKAESVAGGVCDDRSQIQFEDPLDEIPDLSVRCSGVLAVGGFCTRDETTRVSGRTFLRISEGDATINDSVGTCLCRQNPERCSVDLLETVAHEIGHAIGLGHSSESRSESNRVLREALMYAFAHHDGRGAALNSDDIDAVTFVYPVPIEVDTDHDGVPDLRDRCPSTPSGFAVDADGCACTEPGAAGCDDGNACTIDRCIATSGACRHDTINCSDGDPCTVDSCDPPTGACINDLKGDSDGDGPCDPLDNCPLQPFADPTDLNGDGVGDVCQCADAEPGRCVPGRGGPGRRCLVEWLPAVTPRVNASGLPSGRLSCVDGDPSCDDDGMAGQCTFRVALCINNEDPRLAACEPSSLRSLRVRSPKPARPRDRADAVNAASLVEAIDLDQQALNTCSEHLPIVVPTRGERSGSKRLRVRAETAEGRRAKAALKLTCRPAALP